MRTGDLGVERIALLAQLVQALDRIRLGAVADLLQQRKQREQARLGAHERPLGERQQPGNGLFGRGRELELRLVGARLVKLAQPALVGRGPVVQVFAGRLGVGVGADLLAQGVELVLQRLGQVGLVHHPHVGCHKHPVQKARQQRRMSGSQQAPSRVALAQHCKGGVFHGHRRALRGADGLIASRQGRTERISSLVRRLPQAPCHSHSIVAGGLLLTS